MKAFFRLCLVCSNHITSSLRHGIASRLVSAVDGALSTLCFTLPKTLHLLLLRASLVLLVGWLQRILPLHSLGKAGSATGHCGSTNSGWILFMGAVGWVQQDTILGWCSSFYDVRLVLTVVLVGKLPKVTPSVSSGQMTEVTTSVILWLSFQKRKVWV